DPSHRLAKQMLGNAVPDLITRGHTEHELHEAMVEERPVHLEVERCALAIRGPEATGRRFSENVLIRSIFQIAPKRMVHHRLESAEIEEVGLDSVHIPTKARLVGQTAAWRRKVNKAFETFIHDLGRLSIDRVIVVLRPSGDLAAEDILFA